MTVRTGRTRRPRVAVDHAAHEAEKAALRARIVTLEAERDRYREALERLLAVWNRLHDGGDT